MSRKQRQGKWSDKESTFTGSDCTVYEILPEPQHRKSKRANKVSAPPPLPPPRPTPPQSKRTRPSPAETAVLEPSKRRSQAQKNLVLTRSTLSPGFPVKLSDIVTKYPYCLPVRVQVHNGYYSSTTELFVAQNEVFDLHLIKHTKVVTLKSTRETGKEELSLPLNSTVEFAVLYDPNHNESEARKGFLFDTVTDVIASKYRPLVVRATRAYKGSSLESSVGAGELLLLTGVKSSSFPGRGKQLQACSLTNDGKEKQLHEKCAGAFSTKPEDVRMMLSAMIQHKFTLPQTVVVFPDRELDSFLPSSIASSPVTLEGYKGETSIVATQVASASTISSFGDQQVLDIHLSVDIEVEPLQLNKGEQLQLTENTLALYKNFDASNIQVYVENPTTRMYDAQSLLYKRIARDRPSGIQLQWPNLLEDESSESNFSGCSRLTTVPLLKPSQTSPGTSPVQSRPPSPLEYETVASSVRHKPPEGIYQLIDPCQVNRTESIYTTTPLRDPTAVVEASKSKEGIPPEAALLKWEDEEAKEVEKRMETFEVKLTGYGSQIAELSSKFSQTSKKVAKFESADKGTSEAITGLTRVCTQMQEQIQQLESRIALIAVTPNPPGVGEVQSPTSELTPGSCQDPHTTITAEGNRKFLASLDCDKVYW